MRRWLTFTVIGTGAEVDPYRPDLRGVSGLSGYSVAASDGRECLVLLRREQGPLDVAKGKAKKALGDEDHGPNGERFVGATLRAVLKDEAARLGSGGEWEPAGYDIRGNV